MTIIITESFDAHAVGSTGLSAYLNAKHGKFIAGVSGRTSSASMAVPIVGRHLTGGQMAINNFFYSTFDPAEEDDVVIVGFALTASLFVNDTSNGCPVIGEMRTSTGVFFPHIRLAGSATSGQLTVVGPTNTVLGTYAYPGSATWKYVEVKVKVHDTAGTVEVRVDGTTVINVTGADTRNNNAACTGLVNCVGWVYPNVGGGATYWLDDIYILNEQGSSPFNDFLGDVTISYLQPNGVGSQTDWTPSAGLVPNWDMVSDLVGSGAPIITDFNITSVTNNKDLYVVENLPQVTPSTPLAVVNYAGMDKADTGPRNVALVTKVSGVESQSADLLLRDSSNGGLCYMKQVLQTKPGGGAWSITDVNAMEIGVVCRS
jgi:hypothetical protein